MVLRGGNSDGHPTAGEERFRHQGGHSRVGGDPQPLYAPHLFHTSLTHTGGAASVYSKVRLYGIRF